MLKMFSSIPKILKQGRIGQSWHNSLLDLKKWSAPRTDRFHFFFFAFFASLRVPPSQMKILILRFSSIGDIVLTTPVVRVVKTQVDNAEVHFATKPQYKAVIEANPYIDKIHLLNNGLRNLIGELRQEKFDFVIDL